MLQFILIGIPRVACFSDNCKSFFGHGGHTGMRKHPIMKTKPDNVQYASRQYIAPCFELTFFTETKRKLKSTSITLASFPEPQQVTFFHQSNLGQPKKNWPSLQKTTTLGEITIRTGSPATSARNTRYPALENPKKKSSSPQTSIGNWSEIL